MRGESVEVVVVGAGVAGLAAARELRRSGRHPVVLEARDRIGGRIFTVDDARLPVAVELGAEFVHGAAPLTAKLLSAAGLAAYDVAGEQWIAESGRLRRSDFSLDVNGVLGRIDAAGPDLSFADFLAAERGHAVAADRRAALAFVEGFHAADPELISARSIAPGSGEPAAARGAAAGRVQGGYGRLTRWLAGEVGDGLRLGSPVRSIRWRRGAVEVEHRGRDGGASRLHARAAVVTVPLGVLQAPAGEPGGLTFDPDPARLRRGLEGLVMGDAVRVAVWFRELPWERASPARGETARRRAETARRLATASFLLTRSSTFQAWWTAYPLRFPLLVGWAGGPPAAPLAGREPDEVIDTALAALAESLGVSRRQLASRVLAAWTHDWLSDPYARGAYSYVRVGGLDALRLLARPIQQTLFFAGEATDEEHSGTVEGAIGSGLRAARQVVRALGGGNRSAGAAAAGRSARSAPSARTVGGR